MAWSDVARGVQGAVQQQLLRRMHEQQLMVQAQEQQRRTAMETRTADRADASLALQGEQFDAGQRRLTAQDAIAADDKAFTRGSAYNEAIPPDAFLGESDPAAAAMQKGGFGSSLSPQEPTPAMGSDFTGPMPNAESPQQAQVGRPRGFIKTPSQKQGDTATDNALKAQIAQATQAHQGVVEDRAIGAEERAVGTAAEAARHNRAMENKPTGGGGDSLDTFEAKEKIKAKYAGSRPSVGAERQTLSYYNRAKEATENIAPLEDEIAGKSLAGQARLQLAPNWLQSDTNQSYRQAQRAFTEARLRKESGAAIPIAEYENDARTYFAQPGDGKAVLEQKRKARAIVLSGMKNASGKAYDEYYGQPASTPGKSGIKILKIEEIP